jgi:HEAT repeat protein
LIGLLGLWLTSLLLAGAALLIMIGLIVGRFIGSRRQRIRLEERKRLLPLLLAGDETAEGLARAKVSTDLLADLAVELIQMVRGEDRNRLVAAAARAGVPRRLLLRLNSRSSRVRMAAAEALAEFRFRETVDALVKALGDGNDDVRLAAAMSLAAMEQAPSAQRLVDTLGIGSVETSLLTVGLFEEIAASRPHEIRALIENPRSPGLVKAAAIDSLSASGDYSLVPLITRLAVEADADAEELPRYLRSLGRFGHPAAAAAVERALGADVAEVRAAACEAAGKIALVETAGRLAELLGDEDWWVRFRAGEALSRLGAPGRALLIEVARGGEPIASQAAELTLAERGMRA